MKRTRVFPTLSVLVLLGLASAPSPAPAQPARRGCPRRPVVEGASCRAFRPGLECEYDQGTTQVYCGCTARGSERRWSCYRHQFAGEL